MEKGSLDVGAMEHGSSGMVMVNGPQGMVCLAACKVLDPCSI